MIWISACFSAEVTNREFKELEVISSSVKVWSDGRATKAMSHVLVMLGLRWSECWPP